MLGHSKKRTLVIVDDDAVSRELLKFFCEDIGVETLEFADGESAVDFLRRSGHRRDIFGVCTDMKMVQGDGLNVIEQLRELADWRNLPILVCSGVDPGIYQDLLARYGVKHFLQKPVVMVEFQRVVETLKAQHQVVVEPRKAA